MRYFRNKKLFALVLSALFLLSPVLSVKADESVSVTGNIPPHTTDFQITAANNTTGSIAQNHIVTYTVTYGTPGLYYADHITLEAYWDEGTISGGSSPTIDPMTYISGSASKAYNNTSPVVDLTNNKISWSISSFPAQTSDQTVTFQLKTNSSYTGSSTVDFPLKVRIIATNYTTEYHATDITYQYDASQVTPTPTPGPTNTPTPGPTNTPTPGPTKAGTPTPTSVATPTPTAKPTSSLPTFNNVSILNLTSSIANIGYIVTKKGNVSFSYGTTPSNLGNTQTSTNPGYGVFQISSLLPQQKYYFQLSLNGDSTEIYSFTTPVVSQIPQIVKTSLVIATDNDVLYSAGLQNNNNNNQNLNTAVNKIPTIAVAPSTTYSLSFKISKTQDIKSVQVLLQNSNVLGIATTAFAQELQQYPYIYTASNKGNGVYAANIANSLPPGSYNMFLVVRDAQGNITTEQVASVHILHPFQAFNSKSKQPIEDVRITLYRYDQGSYSAITDAGVKNPLYTNRYGTVEEQLVTGKYEAVFGRIGYTKTIKYFSIGISPTDDYPTAYMSQQPITITNVFMYYWNALIDWRAVNAAYFDNLRASYRFFDLFGLAVIFCFTITTLLIFKLKTNIPLSHMPFYLHHHGLLLFGQKQTPYLAGTITDENKNPVSQAEVFALDPNSRQQLAQTQSNTAGGFLFKLDPTKDYTISVMKLHYEPVEETPYSLNMHIILPMRDRISLAKSPITILKGLLILSFEFLLIFSFVLEMILFPAFGIVRTAPFVFMSSANLLLWITYIREKRKIA